MSFSYFDRSKGLKGFEGISLSTRPEFKGSKNTSRTPKESLRNFEGTTSQNLAMLNDLKSKKILLVLKVISHPHEE